MSPVWFTSRHGSSGGTRENGPGAADGDVGHSSLVRETATRLEERGDDVFLEIRNAFEATGSRSGARIAGRPDIIARHADGNVTVYDVGSGGPAAPDDVRIRLLMHLLPRSNHGRWRGTSPDGCVLYADGTERRVRDDEVDDKFRERVATVMREIAADEPARYVPSAKECGRCVLTGDDCSERIEAGSRSPEGDRSDGVSSVC